MEGIVVEIVKLDIPFMGKASKKILILALTEAISLHITNILIYLTNNIIFP